MLLNPAIRISKYLHLPAKLLFKFRLTCILSFTIAIPAFSQLNVYAYMDEAKKEMDKKQYFDAIQKLDVCIAVRPGEYLAYFYRGVCKYYLKDNLGAEIDLNSSMSAYNPMLYEAYHYRSLVKYRLGDYQGAIKDINHDIDGEKNDAQLAAELYVERAFFELSNQGFKESISDCDNAMRMHYRGENVYMCEGLAENALNKYDSALINYHIALKLNPGDIDIYVRIGITDYNLSNYKEAIEQYDYALKLDSSYTLAYYNRAQADLKLNNDKEAMADYTMVINYDQMNALAYFNRSVLEADKNNFTDAIADLDKVLVLNPQNIEALFNRAKIKYRKKDYQGALADYNTTIELFPYLVEAYYERGHLKETLKDYTGAKADYKLAKVMGELSSSGGTLQRTNDSTTLTHLMTLNSNFNTDNTNLPDTTNIEMMPLFYIALKHNNTEMPDCTPLLFKKSRKEYLHFCLTNKKTSAESNSDEQVKNNEESTEALIEKAIQETNMQLFRAATKDYDKIISQDTAPAIAYFARGINICEETEKIGQLNNNEQDSYIDKTYTVVNNPVNDQYEKALADFNKVIQMEPDFAYAYYDRAYIKYKMHDFNGAVSDCNYALQINPGFADAYYNRGLLLFCLNYKMNACEDFSKAGELGLTEAYLIIKIYCSQVTK